LQNNTAVSRTRCPPRDDYLRIQSPAQTQRYPVEGARLPEECPILRSFLAGRHQPGLRHLRRRRRLPAKILGLLFSSMRIQAVHFQFGDMDKLKLERAL